MVLSSILSRLIAKPKPNIDMDAQTIFDKFKTAYPNNREDYIPTPSNIARWDWHLKNTPQRVHGGKVEPNPDAIRIAQDRRVKSFEEMPEDTKEKYLVLASLFPGRQIWACGSRVSGEFIGSEFPDRSFSIRWMRKELGRAEKPQSDYDFWMPLLPGENRVEIMMLLPSWADLLPHGVPDEQKILVPMWDFDKLPKEEHGRVLEAYRLNRTAELMQIHNKYKLSPTHYCCNSKPVVRWFKWAIDEGLIKEGE